MTRPSSSPRDCRQRPRTVIPTGTNLKAVHGDLSGQDFWTLAQTGYMPQALVMGTCVYHIAHRGIGQALGQIGQNAELENFTQACTTPAS